MPKKIVLDTNVFISAILFGGTVRVVLEAVLREHHLCVSEELIQEVQEKLVKKFSAQETAGRFGLLIQTYGQVFSPHISLNFSIDPDDSFLLELSETCGADYLITGDRALLSLNHWKETLIIKPSDFLVLSRTF